MKAEEEKNIFKESDINGVAQDYCNYADRAYIAARTLFRNDCFDQFLYFAHQSIELYLKSILIFHRVKANRIGHDLDKLYKKNEELNYFRKIDRIKGFVCGPISEYNAVRYPDFPFQARFEWLDDLDFSIWFLRFYTTKDDKLNTRWLYGIDIEKLFKYYTSGNRGHSRVGGYIERVLKNKDKHQKERGNLIWKNLYFGKKRKKQIYPKRGQWGRNNYIFCGPSDWQKRVYENVKDYVKFPKEEERFFKSL